MDFLRTRPKTDERPYLQNEQQSHNSGENEQKPSIFASTTDFVDSFKRKPVFRKNRREVLPNTYRNRRFSPVLVLFGLFADPAMKIRYLVLPPCHFVMDQWCSCHTSDSPATTGMSLFHTSCHPPQNSPGGVQKIPGPTLQNTRVLIPGMVLDGSASCHKVG